MNKQDRYVESIEYALPVEWEVRSRGLHVANLDVSVHVRTAEGLRIAHRPLTLIVLRSAVPGLGWKVSVVAEQDGAVVDYTPAYYKPGHLTAKSWQAARSWAQSAILVGLKEGWA